MARSLDILAASILFLVFSIPACGQDSPSLGDLARQAQKNRERSDKPAAKVITNDDIPSRSIPSAPAAGAGSIAAAGSVGAAQPGTLNASESASAPSISTPAEGIEKIQSTLDHLDSLDRTTLATTILDGNGANFAGRAQWEERLFAAKQSFVSQGRALLQTAKQLEASAGVMKDIQDPNDPRVKSFAAKLEQLVQENQQNSAAFQSVVAEGKSLASQPVPH